MHYAFENRENREISWYPKGVKGYAAFSGYILFNLLILPNSFIGLKNMIKYKDSCWLLHPAALFFNTGIYFCIGLLKLLR